LARAYVRTGATSGTVVSGYGHGELHSRHTDHIDGLCSFRSLGKLVLGKRYRTDNRVRTNVCTPVTLDTVLRFPYRDVYRDTTSLVCGRSGRSGTVYIILEGRYRKCISFLCVYLRLDILNKIYNVSSAALNFRCEQAFV